MRKENGITLLVLVITIIILLIIMGITFSVIIGDEGMIRRTSETSFEAKIDQIIELMDEKEDLYNLENVTNENFLPSSVKQSILGEYYSSDENKRTLDIDCKYSEENGIVMTLVYKKSAFSDYQIEILEDNGAVPMT